MANGNRIPPRGQAPRRGRLARWRRLERGQSFVELALGATVLVLLLLAGVDFGRVMFTWVALNSAARAGADYGTQMNTTAGDVAGIQAAANADWVNNYQPTVTTLMRVTVHSCTCIASATTTTQCTMTPMGADATPCATYPTAAFLKVDTYATFDTLLNYPGVPNQIPLHAEAIMQVQP